MLCARRSSSKYHFYSFWLDLIVAGNHDPCRAQYINNSMFFRIYRGDVSITSHIYINDNMYVSCLLLDIVCNDQKDNLQII